VAVQQYMTKFPPFFVILDVLESVRYTGIDIL